MNSSYGRISMNPYRNDGGIVWDEAMEWYKFNNDRHTKHVFDKREDYIPYGVFVTSWARHQLVTEWDKVGCLEVIHSDTDSIVFTAPSLDVEGLNITPNDLDTWGNDTSLNKDFTQTAVKRFVEGGVKKYTEWLKLPEEIQVSDDVGNCVKTALAGIPQKMATINGVSIPVGMWLEVLDDDLILLNDDAVLGKEHYSIKSKWIRDKYIAAGLDPDDVDTRKTVAKKTKGGISIEKTTFKIGNGFCLKNR